MYVIYLVRQKEIFPTISEFRPERLLFSPQTEVGVTAKDDMRDGLVIYCQASQEGHLLSSKFVILLITLKAMQVRRGKNDKSSASGEYLLKGTERKTG